MIQKLRNVLVNQDLKELTSKGINALFIRIMGFISGYLYLFLIVRYFGAETNGLLALSFSVMMITALLCRMGVDINLTKVFAISSNLNNAKGIYFKLLPLLFLIAFILSGLVFILAKKISLHFFSKPELEPFLKWTAPACFFFAFVIVNAAVLRGLRFNSLYSFFFNGGRFLFSVAIFSVAVFLFKIDDPIISVQSHTWALIVLGLLSFFFAIKKLGKPSTKSNYKLKSFVLDSFPMLISTSIILFLGWTDTAVLGIFSDSVSVGVYNIVLKIAMITSFTFQALDSILAPKLSNSFHKKDQKTFISLIRFSTRINLIISMFVVLVLIIFKDSILGIFGNEFHIGSSALVVLCIGQLVNATCGPVGSILQMTGHQKQFQNILFGAMVLNLTLNLILVKPYGLLGVSIATALGLCFWNFASVLYIYKVMKINILYLPFKK